MPRSLLAKPLGETQPASGLTTGGMTVDEVTLRQSLNQNQVVCKGIIGAALVCISWESGPRGGKVSSRWWRVMWICKEQQLQNFNCISKFILSFQTMNFLNRYLPFDSISSSQIIGSPVTSTFRKITGFPVKFALMSSSTNIWLLLLLFLLFWHCSKNANLCK